MPDFPPSPESPGVAIVDDANAVVVGDWRLATEGNPDEYRYTGVITDAATSWVTWFVPPAINEPGAYEVYARIPNLHSTTEGAQYLIHSGVDEYRAIVFQKDFDFYDTNWAYLGEYDFTGSGNQTEYIRLFNSTLDEIDAVGVAEVAADQIMFVRAESDTIPLPTPTPEPQQVILAAPLDVLPAAPPYDLDLQGHVSDISGSPAAVGNVYFHFNPHDGSVDGVHFDDGDSADFQQGDTPYRSMTIEMRFHPDSLSSGKRTLANALW